MVIRWRWALHDHAVSAGCCPTDRATLMSLWRAASLTSLVFALASSYFGAFVAAEKLNETWSMRRARARAGAQLRRVGPAARTRRRVG